MCIRDRVRVERRSAWVSVQMPDVQEYVNVAAGAEASNMVLFSLSIDSSCPAGEQEVAVIVEHQGRRWTNGTNISVVRVPHIAVIMSNLVEMVEGEERLLVVSNTGLADLEVRVRELVALGTAGYSWVSNEMSNGLGLVWQDISRIGAAVEVGDNDGMSGMMDVGFMFPLYGKKYQWMSIGANGGIGFTNGTFYYRNRSLPTTTTYAPAVFVAPLWCDLEPLSGGRVWRYSDGFQSIVTWEGVPVYGMNTAVTFQAILRRNGEIEYQYLRSGGIVTNTIGIQGGAGPGGPAVQVAYNQPFVRDGLVVRIRPREEGRVLEIDPEEATVGPGGAAAVKVKCMPLGSGSGAERVIVVVQHNDPRAGPGIVEGTVVIPEGVSGLWFGVVGVWATRRYVF
ncbi:MAG: hypothetical protein N2595_02755, partial [bacterium]|nr:hypothetical protein [bacterium]